MSAISVGHMLILMGLLLFPLSLPVVLLVFIRKPPGPNRYGASAEPMTAEAAIAVCLRKYADFNGRAGRSEFWWFYLFTFVFSGVLTGIGMVTGMNALRYGTYAFFLPTLAVSARRLHDINRSGWWTLLTFGLGWFALLFLWAQPSQNDQAQVASVFE